MNENKIFSTTSCIDFHSKFNHNPLNFGGETIPPYYAFISCTQWKESEKTE